MRTPNPTISSAHTLLYGPQRIVIALPNDYASAVRTVVLTKLRRNESFLITSIADGHRHDIWIHPAIELSFTGPFTQPAAATLTHTLMNDANRGTLPIPTATAVAALGSEADATAIPHAA